MAKDNVQYMTLGETLLGDICSIIEFLFHLLWLLICGIFSVAWAIFKVAYCVSIVLTIRDGVQWFCGTGKFRRD